MNFSPLEPILIEVISTLIAAPNKTKIIIVNTESDAQKVEELVKQFTSDIFTEEDIIHIPGYFQAGVFRFESSRKIIAKRIAASYSLKTHFPRIIICSVAGYLRNFPDHKWINENKFDIKIGDDLDPDLLIEQLSRLAYLEVQRVEEVGEFCVRGSIVDFWTPGEKTPSRIEIFGDTVDKIRSFRSSDQRSFQTLESLVLLPSREFVWPFPSQLEKALEKFNHTILGQKVMGVGRANLLEDLRANIQFPGIDDVFYMFAPSIFPAFHTYISSLAIEKNYEISFELIETYENFQKSVHEIEKLYENSYNSAMGKNYPVGKIESVFPNLENAKKKLNSGNSNKSSFTIPEEISSELKQLEKQKFSGRIKKIKELLDNKNSKVENILFLANSKETFIEFSGIAAKYIEDFSLIEDIKEISTFSVQEILADNLTSSKISNNIFCSILNTSGGFYLPNSQTLAISETWLRNVASFERFENFNSDEDNSSTTKSNTEAFLSAQFSDFIEGDLIVHIQHGIARFRGLMTIKILDITGDFLALEYAGNDKIYVPVHKLNLIQKYIGSSESTSLDTLKSSSWEKRKQKAKIDVEKLAKELMEHQARRAMTPGHAFATIDEDYIAFEDAFPYDETLDQTRAIKEIMLDMNKPKAMDRLLCGDVGFGKTEVAMRAAFRCILDGKQVAWLVPTTVLAHQHFRSLIERFQDFGVHIEVLDRSITSANKVLVKIKKGEIDILIGTHRILSKDIDFRDLGLLIVDEEQRFGVLQKEKIKSMSYGIDVLTMTATPIPRTLQMSMVGLRDLSLLTTPPKSRLATKTFVCPFEESTIKDCILFELNRGGQIFYVHNRVEELETVLKYLQNLLPQAKIAIGHGKMSQKDLESTIINFLDGKFNILLCTTIIESGIDMPNVNTIIVQNANHFGLAQLYQLRGRVGRRSTRGYAYLLTSQNASEDDEGMKRLNILKEHQELGSGFVIASHDMEMRGSGNILGDEQSGKVSDVGLETYLQMLDDAIKILGGNKVTNVTEVEISIPLTAQIPENYIVNSKDRLRTYRRFFGARLENSLQNLITECEDRFGPLPEEVKNLAELARIRRWLLLFGALSLTVGEEATEIRLDKGVLQPDISDDTSEELVKRILDVCNRKTKGMRITPDGRLIFAIRKKNFIQDKLGAVSELKRILSLLAGEAYEGNSSKN
ncbi:transcription-repair coupling factor [Fluviispira multicolorata]|uniref:Transcription-repair-coupling factor n=1 Tax=Fluviispira multicolorata TaxID=2654512 RepID=A0A833N4E1_9BACT|nr:transcription-repair coupling factor [Fluviispira multicolorata]KAB8027400.1 transcription-repair coupling factor [Fluviispira multicolorata]